MEEAVNVVYRIIANGIMLKIETSYSESGELKIRLMLKIEFNFGN